MATKDTKEVAKETTVVEDTVHTEPQSSTLPEGQEEGQEDPVPSPKEDPNKKMSKQEREEFEEAKHIVLVPSEPNPFNRYGYVEFNEYQSIPSQLEEAAKP